MTARDRRVIEFVGRLRCVRRDQIQRALPGDWRFPQAVSKLNRRLARLVAGGHLARFRPEVPSGEGSAQYHYHLPGRRPRQWRHAAGVSEAYAQLASDPRLRLLRWETEPVLAGTGGQRADALAMVEARPGPDALVAYIEVDRSTESKQILDAKLRAYRTHERSGLWPREAWVHLQARPTYPLVVVVTRRRMEDRPGVWVVNEMREAIDRWLSMTGSSGDRAVKTPSYTRPTGPGRPSRPRVGW